MIEQVSVLTLVSGYRQGVFTVLSFPPTFESRLRKAVSDCGHKLPAVNL